MESLERRVLFVAGDLDPNFGVGGIAKADFGAAVVVGLDVAAAGERVYAAGFSTADAGSNARIALAAFDSAGRPDRSVGGDGTVVTTVTAPTFASSTTGEMLVQPDGKILVLVGAGSGLGGGVVARFNPDGTPDTSFGGGDAKVELGVGKAMAIAPGGKVVVCGVGPYDAARLNPDGSLDTTFGGDGTVDLNFFGSNDTHQVGAVDVAVMNDGRIVMVGAVDDPDPEEGWAAASARLNPDGSFDPTYGTDGRETSTYGYWDNGYPAVATGPRGEVLISTMEGEVKTRPTVVTGSSTLRAGTFFERIEYNLPEITRMHVQADGKVIVSGTTSRSYNDELAPETLLARYNPDGSFDPTFAHGHVMRPTTDKTALAPDGDVVALAWSGPGVPFTVARYLGSDADNRTTTIQPEGVAWMDNAFVSRANAGYTGTGYTDFGLDSGATVNIPFYAYEPGPYELRIRYANGTHRVRFIKVGLEYGGGKTVGFHPTGTWSRWRQQVVTLNMPSYDDQFATQNVIRFETTGQNGPNIDRIEVVRPEGPAHLQAEDAALSGVEARADHVGYDGSGYADFIAPTGSIEWTVNSITGGSHAVTVRYANGDAAFRMLVLSVNSGPAQYAGGRPTGMWANWATETIEVTLVAGVNRLRLSTYQNGPGPNVDWIMVI